VLGIRHEFVAGVDIFSCSSEEILPTPNDLSLQSHSKLKFLVLEYQLREA